MKALAITMIWIFGWAGLVSCSAEYVSPHTGIKYRFDVPLEAFTKQLPIQVTPAK